MKRLICRYTNTLQVEGGGEKEGGKQPPYPFGGMDVSEGEVLAEKREARILH